MVSNFVEGKVWAFDTLFKKPKPINSHTWS